MHTRGAAALLPLLLALMPLLQPGARAAGEKHAITEGVAAHENLFGAGTPGGAACHRIPALGVAPNGDIIAAVDERVDGCDDLRSNRDINIVARRSADNGATWSPVERVVDFEAGVSASDPSMITDRVTGEVLLFYNHMDHNREPGVYHLHTVRSRDNGATWGAPEDITARITKARWRKDFQFITSGNGIQTRSGVLLHTLVNLRRGLHLFGSNDHGRTWFLADTPLKPGDESRVVELADGGWMVNSRVAGKGMRHVHTSADGGKTWTSRPEPALPDPGCNAGLIRLTSRSEGHDKDRLLFSNANSRESRENLTVRVSYDEGATWTAGKTVYAGPAAYSSLAALKNGEIGLFFEKDDYTENVFVRFSLEWLTDGKDRLAPPKPQ